MKRRGGFRAWIGFGLAGIGLAGFGFGFGFGVDLDWSWCETSCIQSINQEAP